MPLFLLTKTDSSCSIQCSLFLNYLSLRRKGGILEKEKWILNYTLMVQAFFTILSLGLLGTELILKKVILVEVLVVALIIMKWMIYCSFSFHLERKFGAILEKVGIGDQVICLLCGIWGLLIIFPPHDFQSLKVSLLVMIFFPIVFKKIFEQYKKYSL
jgi:hypothetical protein